MKNFKVVGDMRHTIVNNVDTIEEAIEFAHKRGIVNISEVKQINN